MKKCIHCGAEIEEASIFCPSCGQDLRGSKVQTNKYAITGFILSMSSIFLSFAGVTSILAMIFSAVALGQMKDDEKGKTLAIIGLVLGVLTMVASVFGVYTLIDELGGW